MECNFCESKLENISNLNYHKKTNKKCLEIQKNISGTVTSGLLLCTFCNKKFANLKKHSLTCKIKKIKDVENLIENIQTENARQQEYIKKVEIENIELKEYIIKLETENNIYRKDHDIITSLAKQPKNNTTNNTSNNYNLSVYDDKIIQERFTLALTNAKPSDLYEGQKSIGRIVAPCLKNDDGTSMISCSDSSRNVFLYKDCDGNINKDIKCKNLAILIEPIATAKVDELIKEDDDKRRKMSLKKFLKNSISDRIREIEKLENHIIGYTEGTKGWKHVRSQIEGKQNQNQIDLVELRILESDEIDCNSDFFDEKLAVASDDIKDMKKDSCKFSKTISELV